jgi:hypothetical protein
MVDHAVVMEALMAQLDDPSLQHAGKRALERKAEEERTEGESSGVKRRGQKVSPVA